MIAKAIFAIILGGLLIIVSGRGKAQGQQVPVERRPPDVEPKKPQLQLSPELKRPLLKPPPPVPGLTDQQGPEPRPPEVPPKPKGAPVKKQGPVKKPKKAIKQQGPESRPPEIEKTPPEGKSPEAKDRENVKKVD